MEVAYVAVVVSDPETVQATFERHLKLARADVHFAGRPVPAFQVGRTRIVVLTPDSPGLGDRVKTGLHHVALEAADPIAAAAASGLCSVKPTAVASFDGGDRKSVV